MSDPSTSLAAGPLSTAPRKEATEKSDLEGAGIGKETALGGSGLTVFSSGWWPASTHSLDRGPGNGPGWSPPGGGALCGPDTNN